MPWQLPDLSYSEDCVDMILLPKDGWEERAHSQAAAEGSHFVRLFELLAGRTAPLQAGARWLAAIYAPDASDFIPKIRLLEYLLQPSNLPCDGTNPTASTTQKTVLQDLPFRVQVNLLLLLCEQRRHFPPRSIPNFLRSALSLVRDQTSWTRQILLDALKEIGVEIEANAGPAEFESQAMRVADSSQGNLGLSDVVVDSAQPEKALARGGLAHEDSKATRVKQELDRQNESVITPEIKAPLCNHGTQDEQKHEEDKKDKAQQQTETERVEEERIDAGTQLLGEDLMQELRTGLLEMEAVALRGQSATFPTQLAHLLDSTVARAVERPSLLADARLLQGASDTLFLLLCRRVMCEGSSAVRAAAWATGAIAPRLRRLESSASAPFLTALINAGKHHPIPVVEGGFSQLAGSSSLNGPQCEVIIRVAKDALSPAARVCLLISTANSNADVPYSGTLQAQWQGEQKPLANEHTVFLLQALLTQKPPLPLDSKAFAHLANFFSRESAGYLGGSVKFVKCISTAISAFGPGIAQHKTVLRQALAGTETFMTKSTMQKLEKL